MKNLHLYLRSKYVLFLSWSWGPHKISQRAKKWPPSLTLDIPALLSIGDSLDFFHKLPDPSDLLNPICLSVHPSVHWKFTICLSPSTRLSVGMSVFSVGLSCPSVCLSVLPRCPISCHLFVSLAVRPSPAWLSVCLSSPCRWCCRGKAALILALRLKTAQHHLPWHPSIIKRQ